MRPAGPSEPEVRLELGLVGAGVPIWLGPTPKEPGPRPPCSLRFGPVPAPAGPAAPGSLPPFDPEDCATAQGEPTGCRTEPPRPRTINAVPVRILFLLMTCLPALRKTSDGDANG